jgi:hypothetical protein
METNRLLPALVDRKDFRGKRNPANKKAARQQGGLFFSRENSSNEA